MEIKGREEAATQVFWSVRFKSTEDIHINAIMWRTIIILVCSTLITLVSKCYGAGEIDDKIKNTAQKSTTYLDEMETCVPPPGISNVLKPLAPTKTGQIMDVKFYPVLLSYPSNYDAIRRLARENALHFTNNEKHLSGDPTPFLNGKIFVLAHGYIDSMDSDVRIFGVGKCQ